MSLMDPAQDTAAALSALQAALAAAQAAPPDQVGVQEDEEDTADIATPRAKAATALETALRSRCDWHRRHGEPAGERVCRTLIDMCSWHEHPELREQVLALQAWGLALLTAAPGGEPDLADADALEDAYQSIKPREDDAAAIAAALGMTLEEARAFGLVGTLDHVGFEDEEPARVPVEAGVASASVPAPEEDLETLFRREALILVGKTLPQALQRFWGAQQSVDALLTVRRCFHTLKGDARVTAQSTPMEVAEELEGLAVLSEAAEDIIDYLLGDDYDTEQPAPGLPPGAFSLLNEVATAIGRRLELRAPLDNEAALLHRLEAMQRKAVAVSGTAIDDATFAAKIPLPKPKQPAPRPTPTKFAPHSLLPTFLEEADRLMPDLHRALAVLSSTPTDEGALVRARVKLHTLKGGAALIGDEALEIQNIAHSAEDLFELIEDFQLRGEMDRVPREVLEGVLDAEDALQVLLDILRRQTQTGRLGSTTRLLPMPPQQLVTMLDSIAERVRRGDIGKPPVPGTEVAAAAGEASAGTGSEAPALVDDAHAPAAERLPHTTRPSSPLLGAVPLPPLPGVGTLASTPLMQRVVLPPSGDVASANEPELARASSASASVDLCTVTFRDLLAGIERTEIRTAGAVADWARLVEDRTRAAREPFTLFTCVQLLSNYEQDRERYCKLAHEHGHLYVFGKADALPLPAEHTTFVPLEDGDALLAERVVIVDTANNPMAFFACTVGTDAVQPVQTYTTAYVEARAVVQEAVMRLRAVLQRDAALIATRRAGVPGTLPQLGTALPDRPEAAPAERQRLHRDRTPRSVPEYGKDYSVGVALSALEDLSVSRDALQELVAEMLRQSIESRRSSRRLRTLVERVSVELSGLRSELVRTSRRSGDWDLLEKEEYTTVDVLLMQLDEALADLEESDSNLRRDLGEAQAQVEIQADNQLRAQRSLLNMSMIPFSQLEDRLNHAVRSQSRRLGKQVGFSLEGGELVLDGHIAESLFEPLMHLINNALDHGIEENAADRVAAGKPVEGHLTIRGRANGDGVAIDVTDDGRGIDPERIAAVAVSRGIVSAQEAAGMSAQDRLALIWRPGFSTARRISTISGRGMGLQSVLDEIIGLQGRIEIHSEVGKGTTFTVLLPRSLAMLRVEVVREGRDLLAFPITQVVATHPVAYTAVENADPGLVLHLGGRDLTVYSAHLATGPAGDGEAGHGMLLEVAGRSGGILVDEVIGSQYLPVRAAPDYLRRHCGVLGYAVGGAGRILPILDLPTLVDRSAPDQPIVSSEQPARPAYSVLVVDDSQTMRRALRDTLSKAGFVVREAADGRDALTICTRAMPDLITLDMEMPGMDGLEALSALRLLPNGGDAVPVFMITSRQQARHRAAALAAGVTRYFTKPYDTDELIGAAQLVLAEGSQQRREAAS